MLELAIGRVVGENSLSRVELVCCINDWRGRGGREGEEGKERRGDSEEGRFRGGESLGTRLGVAVKIFARLTLLGHMTVTVNGRD